MENRRRKYHCKQCGKVIVRLSDKQWINSMCDATGKDARLVLVKAKKR